jgi:hypothetical protein
MNSLVAPSRVRYLETPDLRAIQKLGSRIPEPSETVEKLGDGAEFFVAVTHIYAKQALRRNAGNDGSADALRIVVLLLSIGRPDP